MKEAASVSNEGNPVLDVRELRLSVGKGAQAVHIVRGVDFSLKRGKVLGVLGESGSGKSMMLRSVLGLLPAYADVSGSIVLEGQEMVGAPRRKLREIRGSKISMIFQEPMTAFDPVYTIGQQIVETIIRHDRVSRVDAGRRALELMELVAIPSAATRLQNYPHEMSGGMRQRAMIALALACRPKVLLADEPTTALDVTVQIQILLLLRRLVKELDMSIIFVTHDIGVATEISDDVAVMYAGRFVEKAPIADIVAARVHPYTEGLLSSTVHGQRKESRLGTIPGAPPDPAVRRKGCAFAPRCVRIVRDICETVDPPETALSGNHTARCVHAAGGMAGN